MEVRSRQWRWLFMAMLVAALVTKAAASEEEKQEEKDESFDVWASFGAERGSVIELDDRNFERAIASVDRILVDFYAPWCGHCKRLSPELDAAAPVLARANIPVVVAKLNADKFTKLASKYDIGGYPTLKLFVDGTPTEYSGPRRAESLVLHVKKLSALDLIVLNSLNEIWDYIRSAGNKFPIFIGFGMQESILIDLAKEYKKRAWFAIAKSVTDEAMVEFDFDKTPALLVLRPEQNEQDVFYGPFEGEFLQPFIDQSLLPLCVSMRHETLNLLKDDKRPIVLTIMKDETEEASLQLIKTLKAAASANRDLVFAYVGMKQWDELADSFNAVDTKLPMIILWNGDLEYYIVEDLESLTEGNYETEIFHFLEAYRQGKAVKKEVQGPSFRGFLQYLMSMRTLYTLAFVIVIIAILLLMFGSESRGESNTSSFTERKYSEQRLLDNESDHTENREVSHNKVE